MRFSLESFKGVELRAKDVVSTCGVSENVRIGIMDSVMGKDHNIDWSGKLHVVAWFSSLNDLGQEGSLFLFFYLFCPCLHWDVIMEEALVVL